MTVMIVGAIVLVAVLVACVVVLTRRGGSGTAGSHGTSAAELDASARSAAARSSDRQGYSSY